jgi:hypothetical protein
MRSRAWPSVLRQHTAHAHAGVGHWWAVQRADMQLLRFAVAEGDLVTYLNVWKAWDASGRAGRWAHKHLVNHRTMLRAADIRRQLLQHLWRASTHTARDARIEWIRSSEYCKWSGT